MRTLAAFMVWVNGIIACLCTAVFCLTGQVHTDLLYAAAVNAVFCLLNHRIVVRA